MVKRYIELNSLPTLTFPAHNMVRNCVEFMKKKCRKVHLYREFYDVTMDYNLII